MSSTVNPVINKRTKVKTEVEGLPPVSPTTQVTSLVRDVLGPEAAKLLGLLASGNDVVGIF